ncbi:GNAT family N-acetyltransferase [Flavobacterium sp. AG291]|uniref:GNAT family N-acetyltransferase n=1 Tax=Flavobacterium sp. AG291 TaxID=2184000 RepID=UPI000E0BA1E1|nr:GNAT family N-acetyltransferase [Flavobacterium sp. AG291]
MSKDKVIIRRASLSDLPEMKELFRETIQYVCANEYDDEQRKQWASSSEKTERWENLIRLQYVLLAIKHDVIVGFGSLLDGNYLDFMYVHKDYQRQGIADLLLRALEAEALRQKATVITSDISKTARPFFEKKGYVVVTEQQNQRGDVILINYKMKKEL